jgi:peptidoglycan/xylan/chitin deacetylase (PgdA/CDA1 family)
MTALRSDPVLRAGTAMSARSLRVIAYHDVVDPGRLDAQLHWLVTRYHPVTAEDVTAAAAGSPLAKRAAWVTFDDGCPGVVELGLDILDRHGIQATMYLCPGLIESGEPFWWDVVLGTPLEVLREVLAPDVRDADDAVARLKQLPDSVRRQVVARLPPLPSPGPRQLTDDQIDRLLAAGHRLGSHTWDHPCLDRCDPDEQHRQIRLADGWLRDRVRRWVPRFAYPNGNWSRESADLLRELGYVSAVLHDHRLADPSGDPLRVSRLHVDAADDLDRFRSIASGIQPALRRAADAMSRWLPVGVPRA